MLTKAWTQFKYHPVQAQAWTCPKRFVAIPAGRGSGKTEMAKRRLVRMLPVIKNWADPRYFYGAPTRGQAKRIAWRSFLNLIPKEWVVDVSKTELRIETRFGSMLYVVGLDEPARIEGDQWDGCVLDESCDLRPKTFDLSILPALSWRTGWCWRIGVPKRQGASASEYRRFFEEACSGDIPDRAGFTWPSGDILPAAAIQYAREHMDPKDFNEQYNARFETAGGGIFHSYDSAYNVRPVNYVDTMPIVVGSDFNVDPMCWVIGHRADNGLVFFDEIFRRNTNTAETLDVLFGRYQNHKGGFEFYGDASSRARKTSASESDYHQIHNHPGFKKLGRTVHYPRGNPSIHDRFASCNALFCNAAGRRRLFIDPRCKNLIGDCEQRYYKPGTNTPADGGDLGHMTDAMGYPVHRLFPIRVRIEHRPEPVVIVGA